jgi:hypothetical protein
MVSMTELDKSVTFKLAVDKEGSHATTESPYIATLPIHENAVLQKLTVHAYRNSHPRRQQRRILATETDRMKYVGNNYEYTSRDDTSK